MRGVAILGTTLRIPHRDKIPRSKIQYENPPYIKLLKFHYVNSQAVYFQDFQFNWIARHWRVVNIETALFEYVTYLTTAVVKLKKKNQNDSANSVQ